MRLRGTGRCVIALVSAVLGGVVPTVGAAPAPTPTPVTSASAQSQRPNIVFILSDDHAWQAISAYPGAIAHTPAIERIGREGAVLDRMLSPNSLCAPARAMLLTGKLSRANGVRDNYDKFNGAQPTLQSLLRASGYHTALFGKWHLKSTPSGFDEWEVLSDLQGQGRYWNPEFQTAAGTVRRHGYASSIITDRTLHWLRNRPRDNRPFLLLMWHKGPHRPFDPDVTAPAPRRASITPPASYTFDLSARSDLAAQRMEIARDLNPRDLKLRYPAGMDAAQRSAWDARYAAGGAGFRASRPLGPAYAAWTFNRYIQDYLNAADSVDDSVGAVLAELDRQGLSRDTVVIYSSDQGFYLGENGWFDKRWYFEPSLRTPFVMRWPGRIAPGTRIDALASQVDVLPTLLDVAGVSRKPQVDGLSLVPVLTGGTRPARDGIYLRYHECPGEHAVPCFYGLAGDRYKLVFQHQLGLRQWILTDRVNDPGETRNFYDDPAYVAIRADLHRKLDSARAAADDTAEPETAGAIGRRFLVTLAERVVKLFQIGESAQ